MALSRRDIQGRINRFCAMRTCSMSAAVTDVPGGADRHGVHLPNASPRLHTPPPMPVPAGRHRRLDQTPDRYPGALELDARPDGLVADDSRWTTHSSCPGHG